VTVTNSRNLTSEKEFIGMARPTLKLGMKGNKGSELGDAIFLWRVFVGLPPAKNVTSFDYGALTVEKTKTFQKKNGLTVNGEVDEDTWEKYDALQYGPPVAPASPAAQAAADKIASGQTPPSAAAHEAAASIAGKKAAGPAKTTTASTTAPAAAKFLSVPKSVKEAKEQVVHHLNQTPLWLRVVGGAIGAGASFLGLKKLLNK
jgi:hypothetical protein